MFWKESHYFALSAFMLLKRVSMRSCILINLKWNVLFIVQTGLRNITRIKLQLHLRITFISSTWSIYSYYNIYIYIHTRKKEVYFARILIKHPMKNTFHIFIEYFIEYLLLYRISITSITIILLIFNANRQTDNAIRDSTRLEIEWYDFLYLNSGEKNIFIIYIVLNSSLNGTVYTYTTDTKRTEVRN